MRCRLSWGGVWPGGWGAAEASAVVAPRPGVSPGPGQRLNPALATDKPYGKQGRDRDEAEARSSAPVSTRRVRATPVLNDANLGASGHSVRRLGAPETLSRDRNPREAGQTVGQRRFLELDLRKAPRQEVVVGLHVEVPVSAQVEQDDLRLAGLPRTDCLVDHRPDGVVRLRERARSPEPERTVRPRRTPGSACTPEPPCARASPTWTATARRRGTGALPRAPAPARTCRPGVHGHNGRHFPCVAKVVRELTPGQGGAGGRLGATNVASSFPASLSAMNG